MINCASSLSASHLSDFSIASIELYGGTPVTNESFEILELQDKWIEVDLRVIEQTKTMFIQKITDLTTYHLILLNLDQSLSRLFLTSIHFDEMQTMSYLRLLRNQQQTHYGNSETTCTQEFFNTMATLLNSHFQIKCDELNLKSLLETKRKMKFSPCSVEEMHAYHKKIRKERRENDLKASAVLSKRKGKKDDKIPKFIEFQVDMTSSGPLS
jgi:hypothetical protein